MDNFVFTDVGSPSQIERNIAKLAKIFQKMKKRGKTFILMIHFNGSRNMISGHRFQHKSKLIIYYINNPN
jgi:hypothetical protein